MLYISFYDGKDKVGVIDTDDMHETIISRAYLKHICVDLGIQVNGVRIERGAVTSISAVYDDIKKSKVAALGGKIGNMRIKVDKSGVATLVVPDDIVEPCDSESNIWEEYCYEHEMPKKVVAYGGKSLIAADGLFKDYSGDIDLSHFKPEHLRSMFAFICECDLVDSFCKVVGLDSLNTSEVENMSYAFSSGFTSPLDVSSLDTSKCRIMSGMFAGRFQSIVGLENFNTRNVTDMSGMFTGCVCNYVNLSHFDTSSVKDMSEMFYSCNIGTLDISSFTLRRDMDVSDMFLDAMIKRAYVKSRRLAVMIKRDCPTCEVIM